MIKTTNKMITLDKLLEVARELGWNWAIYREPERNYIELSKYSPAGEEFGMVINFKNESPTETFLEGLKECLANFDVDEHAAMWIGERGKNGVPETIRELLDDANAIGEMIADLWSKLSNMETNSSSKHVKQISLDVLVNEDVNGEDLAEIISNTVEEHGYIVIGAGFQEDMTAVYKRDYPELLCF